MAAWKQTFIKVALGSRARSRVARKLPFGVIPAPMAGDDSIPVVGAASLFPEGVVDVFEGLFEHGYLFFTY